MISGEKIFLRAELRNKHLTLHAETGSEKLKDIYDDVMDIDPLQHCQELDFAPEILSEIINSFTIKSLLPEISDNPQLMQMVMQFISSTYDRCLTLASTQEERKYRLQQSGRGTLLLSKSVFRGRELRSSLDHNGRLLIQLMPVKGKLPQSYFDCEVKIPKDFHSGGREPKPVKNYEPSSSGVGSALQDAYDGFDPPDRVVSHFLGRLLDAVSPFIGTFSLNAAPKSLS